MRTVLAYMILALGSHLILAQQQTIPAIPTPNPIDNISYVQTVVRDPDNKQVLDIKVTLRDQGPSCPLATIELGKLDVARTDVFPTPSQIVDNDLVPQTGAVAAEKHYNLRISEDRTLPPKWSSLTFKVPYRCNANAEFIKTPGFTIRRLVDDENTRSIRIPVPSVKWYGPSSRSPVSNANAKDLIEFTVLSNRDIRISRACMTIGDSNLIGCAQDLSTARTIHQLRLTPDDGITIVSGKQYTLTVSASEAGVDWKPMSVDWSAPNVPLTDYKLLPFNESDLVRHIRTDSFELNISTSDAGTLKMVFEDTDLPVAEIDGGGAGQIHKLVIPVGKLPNGRWPFHFDGVRQSDNASLHDRRYFLNIDPVPRVLGPVAIKFDGQNLKLRYVLSRKVNHKIQLTSDDSAFKTVRVLFDQGADTSSCGADSESCQYETPIIISTLAKDEKLVTTLQNKGSEQLTLSLMDDSNQAMLQFTVDALDYGGRNAARIKTAATILMDKSNDKNSDQMKVAKDNLKAALGPDADDELVGNLTDFLRKNRNDRSKSDLVLKVLGVAAKVAGAYFGIPVPSISGKAQVATETPSKPVASRTAAGGSN